MGPEVPEKLHLESALRDYPGLQGKSESPRGLRRKFLHIYILRKTGTEAIVFLTSNMAFLL